MDRVKLSTLIVNVHNFISHFCRRRKLKFCGGSKLIVLGRSILELFFAAGTISRSAALQTDVEPNLWTSLRMGLLSRTDYRTQPGVLTPGTRPKNAPP